MRTRTHHTPLESKWGTSYPCPIANEYISPRYLVGKVWLAEDKNKGKARKDFNKYWMKLLSPAQRKVHESPYILPNLTHTSQALGTSAMGKYNKSSKVCHEYYILYIRFAHFHARISSIIGSPPEQKDVTRSGINCINY